MYDKEDKTVWKQVKLHDTIPSKRQSKKLE